MPAREGLVLVVDASALECGSKAGGAQLQVVLVLLAGMEEQEVQRREGGGSRVILGGTDNGVEPPP